MQIETEIQEQVVKLSLQEKESLLAYLKGIAEGKNQLSSQEKDFILQYNQEIEAAIAAVAAGEYVTHEDVLNEATSW